MFWQGLKEISSHQPSSLFGFPIWHSYESAHAIKSCFYVPVGTLCVRRHIHDVKSTIFDGRTDWSLLHKLANSGWEFGIHAPMRAKDRTEEFIAEKALLERALELPVLGIRHHYWALDWHRPFRTLRRHATAGFRYDTSISWKAPGFRAGTCLPYQPFDSDNDSPLGLYELPPTLMDSYGFAPGTRPGEHPSQAGVDAVHAARDQGGVIVLNWHTEAACNKYRYRGYLDLLNQILQPLLSDQGAWFATPCEVIEHWHRRNEAVKKEATR
jgi:peptidoglycan/xylan/chitin deacetylase (PgdA/CDA1 family)